MSLPEPGRPDLNSTDGSSCPTYSSPSLPETSAHVVLLLWQSGSLSPPELSLAARGDERAPVAALAGSEAAVRTSKPRRLITASMGRFKLLSFRPSAEPGARY